MSELEKYSYERDPSISRKKYDNLKEKMKILYECSHDFQKKYEKLLSSNDELEQENEKLTVDLSDLLEKTNSQIDRWKTYSDNFDELEIERKTQRKTIRSLTKKTKNLH